MLLLLMIGCNQTNQNGQSVQELIKSREIRQVSDAEILEAGEKWGAVLMAQVSGMDQDSLPKTNETLCRSCFTEVSSSLEDSVTINRYFDAKIILDDVEKQLFEAYRYNVENNLDMVPSIQVLDKSTVLYTVPIDSEGNLFKFCLDSCQSATLTQALPLYGMWSIRMPTKVIVNKL